MKVIRLGAILAGIKSTKEYQNLFMILSNGV